MKKIASVVLLTAVAMLPLGASAEVSVVRIPLGAGGLGFLPLYIMKKNHLLEKYAEKAGQKISVDWANIGGAAVMNDALLSGSADFITAGPVPFLILWDKTKGNLDVKGVATMSSMPERLNTNAAHLKTLEDLRETDKIAVNAVKSSMPSIIMQMYAAKKYGKDQVFRFDPYTVTMRHADAAAALLSGSRSIIGHWATSPLDQMERKDPKIHSIMDSDDIMGGSTTFTMVSTTKKFNDENPKICAAFISALRDAQEMIRANRPMAAQVLIDSMGGGTTWSVDDIIKILEDPHTKYTTKPENVMKYALFMNKIGSLKNRPTSINELFFKESVVSSGN